ncbi:restriction endonuclease subunit S [Nostoc sp. C117]|uniref:restriction endonuclease subunit S n=1 Tax=Nostoc sp. C117 TaxID=3349875 RepID=UPI00370D178B
MSKKIKKKVPELRFSEFKEDWQSKTLEELAEWSSGGTPSKEKLDYWNGDIPWISASSMYYDILFDSDQKITELGLENGSRLATKGSILILVRGSILYNRIPMGITGRDLAFNQDVKCLKIQNKRELFFLFYWLKANENLLKSLVSGTGIGAGKLDTSQLKALILFKPFIEEQEKIASFLGAVDRRLTQLRRKQELLQTYKRGVMQKIFSQEIRFKGAIGSEFPDWEEMTLGEITKKIGSGATPRGGEDNYQESGISLFRSMNIYDNRFQEENLAFIDENQARELNNVTVENDDILLNITGASIARCCIAPVKYLPARVNQHVMIIRPKNNKLNSVFLSNLLVFEDYKNQLFKLGGKGGSTREALTKFHIQNFQVILPSIKEQERIANFLTAIDRKIETLYRQIDQTEKFKKGLLQKLFV